MAKGRTAERNNLRSTWLDFARARKGRQVRSANGNPSDDRGGLPECTTIVTQSWGWSRETEINYPPRNGPRGVRGRVLKVAVATNNRESAPKSTQGRCSAQGLNLKEPHRGQRAERNPGYAPSPHN